MNSREDRLKLIQSIQESRGSRLITYVTGDRQGATGQIGRDAVRSMYNHVRALGFDGAPKIDLFLYSQGGVVDVPWRLVTMLREYCQELSVLVPYKAHSAATLIALGADQIAMGKKGELGPIDPILTRTEQGEQTAVREPMSVEDIMAFIEFLKERAGLGDQAALAGSVNILTEKLTPWVLGSIYRTHSHIRMIARKLLTSHQQPLEERRVSLIVETLAEKMYFHGHAIGREEAIEIGLPIEKPDKELEEQMWNLFEAYESLMQLNQPIDPRGIIPHGENEHQETVILACIESETRLDVFRGTLNLHHIRLMPPQLNMNLNLNLQLPPGLRPEQLPAESQKIVQTMLQQLQGEIATIVQSELMKQAPVERTEGSLVNAAWQEVTTEGI
jgi:hypothetical protein